MVSYRKELAGFMARKSLIEREKKREMIAKYADKRQALEHLRTQPLVSWSYTGPTVARNSAPNRQRRCWLLVV